MTRPVRIRDQLRATLPGGGPYEKLWSLVDRSQGEQACWPYTGAIGKWGYGNIYIVRDGRRITARAHRLAYEASKGVIPDGMVVRHTCDNRRCCNPAHLLIGTQFENHRDCVERNRHSPPPHFTGEDHPRAKMTADGAREARLMRARGMTTPQIARHFGIGKTTMAHLLAGRTWKHA